MINIDREALHFPAVAEAGEGWGVYCAACSDAAQEYVYPCERGRTMPPARLVDPVPLLAENERLRSALTLIADSGEDRRSLRLMARAALDTPEGEKR